MREELAKSAIETQPVMLFADRCSKGLRRFLTHGLEYTSDEIARSVV